MPDEKIIQVILGSGLGIITYFLKLIHTDLREVINRVQTQETSLAVAGNKFTELERRIEVVENKLDGVE